MSQPQADYSAVFAGVESDTLAWRRFMLKMYDDCISLLKTALASNEARRAELAAEIKEIEERENGE